MNAVIITTAIREKVATECLERVLLYTPSPRTIILMHCVGKPELNADWPRELAEKHPEVIYCKTDGEGGVTAAWNLGFQIALDEGSNAIACINDDVYVDSSWPNFFDTILKNDISMVGPVSKNPGVDYTGRQRQWGSRSESWTFIDPMHVKKNDGSITKRTYFCTNGFCFGLSGFLCDVLTSTYGRVLNQDKYPWGGQEEDLGERILKEGGSIVIDGGTYVDHIKFSDWRKLGCTNDKVKL